MTFVEELVPHLPEWLPAAAVVRRQGPRGQRASRWRRRRSLTDAEPLLDLLVLAVAFADGGPVQHYQLLLGRRRQARGELEHVAIGRVGGLCAYDALWDHTASAWLLEAVRAGRDDRRRAVRRRAGRRARAPGLRAG